jgi:diaminohydroxyphosphoribosylaminopyrimidine deaminase/5-amino-6-(5-phosphoribosylamino)uracil reductase
MIHEKYMRRAIQLAQKAAGRTSPNPMVGAVLVKGGRVIAEGYHRKAGGPHAEIVALDRAAARARGATLYVSLEPCCHKNKRTPPCVPRIIRSGIRTVVIGSRDPNPRVSGKGIRALRKAGIKIVDGILEDYAYTINDYYNKYIKYRRPFVILKSALTLDGKIAAGKRKSTVITGKPARIAAHHLRDRVDALLVGVNTVIADNPRLTTRLPSGRGKDPVRVILDSRLRIPLHSRVLTQSSPSPTWIAATKRAPAEKIRSIRKNGAEVLILPAENGRVSLKALLRELGRRGIVSLMIEGGGEVNASALSAGIVDRLVWFVAPWVMGGRNAVPVIGGKDSAKRKTIPLKNLRLRKVGDDLMLQGDL